MDIIYEDFENEDMGPERTAVPIERPDALHLEETLDVGEMPVTQPSDRQADLTKVKEEVTKLMDHSLLEFEKQLKEVLENMKESIRADLLLRERARNDEAEGRKDRIRKGMLELDGWLESWVTKWLSKVEKPSDDVSGDHGVNSKMHCDMRHDLRTTLGLMESRTQKDMYMRHMKACDDENVLLKNIHENMEVLESTYKEMTTDISRWLDDMWAKFNGEKLHQNEVHPDTSSGPLDKVATPQMSSYNPSVSADTPRESQEGLDPLNKPHKDLRRSKRLTPIIRIRKISKKLKVCDKAVVLPIIQNDGAGDKVDEVQAERKLQDRIKMFEVKSEEASKVEGEVKEKKAQKKWRRIFSWLLPKRH